MKVLVTGSTGFIGSHLCIRLLQEGHEVLAVRRTGRPGNISTIKDDDNFRLIKYDIRDKSQIDDVIDTEINAIFHLASYIPRTEESEDPHLCFEVNAQGTLNILSAAADKGIKDIVYASTMSVYSEPPEYLPVDEKHPTVPQTVYGRSKLKGEEYCQAYSDTLKVLILRFSGAYGTGLPDYHAVPNFFNQAMNNNPITIHGDGEQTSDYVYISNTIEGMLLAWKKKKTDVFNIGSGEETSVLELAKMIVELTNSESEIILTDEKTHRPFRFMLDIRKARDELGYEPILLKKGLKNYLQALNMGEGHDI